MELVKYRALISEAEDDLLRALFRGPEASKARRSMYRHTVELKDALRSLCDAYEALWNRRWASSAPDVATHHEG